MKNSFYTFQYKDIPYLKKDFKTRLLFSALFLAVFVWQLFSLLLKKENNDISILELVICVVVMVATLLFAMVSFSYFVKSFSDCKKVRSKIPAYTSVVNTSKPTKNGFITMYLKVSKIIAVLSAILLLCVVTYSVLTFVYYETVSFYLPLLAVIVISGFNGAYHIESQIYIMQNSQNKNKFI